MSAWLDSFMGVGMFLLGVYSGIPEAVQKCIVMAFGGMVVISVLRSVGR